MNNTGNHPTNRRNFIMTSAGLISGITLLPDLEATGNTKPADSIHIIGPIDGYSPQVGTLVTMMNWMQNSLMSAIKGLSVKELDYLHDAKSNTIGALIMHLAATEVIYQDLTFNSLKDFSPENKKKWGIAMGLGEEAQKQIKGKPLDYYHSQLKEVRDKTLSELKQRDDQWLMTVDPAFFSDQPTNNYCKWFHVAEHIGNHRGQITWVRKRLPGAKAAKD
ncbi:DinB family protein [Rhodocytophaga rosea]|uniref:DinB family protein n=1 Tax=Rhodocytophaga rosea TaxID=2704465 RepID=UPI0018D865C7|nr:DUF664 domain-containing protein [Rhodocytophaga rosea]